MSSRIDRLYAQAEAMGARRERGVELALAGAPDADAFAGCTPADVQSIQNTVSLIRVFKEISDAHQRDMARLDATDPVMAASVRAFCGDRITRMRVADVEQTADVDTSH